MKIGMVGLGKMGSNMTLRLLRDGHDVVATDLSEEAIRNVETDGAAGAVDLDTLVSQLDAPRVVWVMVPAGAATESTVMELAGKLEPGDIIIDGGNSFYKDTVKLAEHLKQNEIHFVDVGTSGGVWGLEEGYSMMVGGNADVVEQLRPIFETLAPAADKGWGYVGTHGTGHFTKMIHNGIEYGMMQALAEGFTIMKKKDEFDLDLAEISRIWQHGSVIRSWLLDLMKNALETDQNLSTVAAFVPDSGEGRWTVFEAVDLNVSAPVITIALQQRINSRGDGYAMKLLSILRNQFGGHAVKAAEEEIIEKGTS